MSDEVLDLDAIAPEPKKVKFQNEIINVNAPKMSDIFAIGKASQKLDIDANNDVDAAMAELQAALTKVIPDLEGKTLGVAQLIALATLVSKMSTPQTLQPVEEPTEKKDQSDTAK